MGQSWWPKRKIPFKKDSLGPGALQYLEERDAATLKTELIDPNKTYRFILRYPLYVLVALEDLDIRSDRQRYQGAPINFDDAIKRTVLNHIKLRETQTAASVSPPDMRNHLEETVRMVLVGEPITSDVLPFIEQSVHRYILKLIAEAKQLKKGMDDNSSKYLYTTSAILAARHFQLAEDQILGNNDEDGKC